MAKTLALLHADRLCHPATQLLQLMCLEARRRYPEEWPAGAPRAPTGAIGFYESEGYARIPPYGAYVRDPLSLCYEKALA